MGLQTDEPQWRCAFPPLSLKAAATLGGPKTDAHMQQRRASTNTQKVCNLNRRRHKNPEQPLFFSPSLCICFQVSAILSAPAEPPGTPPPPPPQHRFQENKSKGGKKRKQPQEDKVYPPLTFAMAFLYLMTACWISECTFIFPSPHGTTTRVRPKHTVTFMALVSEESPGFGLRRRGRDQEEEEEEEAVRKQTEGAWSSLLVRLCPGIPARGSSSVSAARRRTTLLSLRVFSDHLFSSPLPLALSLSPTSFLSSLAHKSSLPLC